MTDNTIRMRVLTLLGQEGRRQLGQELGMLDTYEALGSFAILSEQQQCEALCDAWRRREFEAKNDRILDLACDDDDDEECDE